MSNCTNMLNTPKLNLITTVSLRKWLLHKHDRIELTQNNKMNRTKAMSTAWTGNHPLACVNSIAKTSHAQLIQETAQKAFAFN